MRIFISIKIPEEVKKEIVKIQDNLPEFVGKKTEIENLHLTLKFLGEIHEEKVKKVKESLEEIDFEKFETEISEIGVFSEKFIRIIWLSLSGCDELQGVVDEALVEEGFDKEQRFMGHLTIGRVKNIKDKKKFFEDLKKIEFENLKFKVDKFYLMESVLKPQGPDYRIIEEFNLKS